MLGSRAWLALSGYYDDIGARRFTRRARRSSGMKKMRESSGTHLLLAVVEE